MRRVPAAFDLLCSSIDMHQRLRCIGHIKYTLSYSWHFLINGFEEIYPSYAVIRPQRCLAKSTLYRED